MILKTDKVIAGDNRDNYVNHAWNSHIHSACSLLTILPMMHFMTVGWMLFFLKEAFHFLSKFSYIEVVKL
jgi:hypothetical protein